MTTPISEYVSVVVSVGDTAVDVEAFDIPAIFDEFAEPSAWDTDQRSASYSSIEAVAVDFATTTKVYKAAAAMFTSNRRPKTIKIIRADSGDANITASLNAIQAADPAWYGLVSCYRVEADLNEIAAWVEASTTKHIFLACSEDTGIPDSGSTTDIAADWEAAAYNRSGLLYHHEGGKDVTDASLTVGTGIATVTKANHGLRVGDLVTISGAAKTQANGNKVVLTTPLSSTFTVDATGASDGADGNNGSIVYFARYSFPESRWMGYGLSAEPGQEDWAFKSLSGQTPVPADLLTLAQQQTIRGKNANVYTSLGGSGRTQVGKMGSGRFIDVQVGIDWLEARIAEAILARRINSPKIPYTQAGINSLIGDIVGVLEQGVRNSLLGPLPDSTSGELWRITMPQLADISDANKIARNLPPAFVVVQLAGSIITFTINVNALV